MLLTYKTIQVFDCDIFSLYKVLSLYTKGKTHGVIIWGLGPLFNV